MCTCKKESEEDGDIKRMHRRGGDRNFYFSIDISDFTQAGTRLSEHFKRSPVAAIKRLSSASRDSYVSN